MLFYFLYSNNGGFDSELQLFYFYSLLLFLIFYNYIMANLIGKVNSNYAMANRPKIIQAIIKIIHPIILVPYVVIIIMAKIIGTINY